MRTHTPQEITRLLVAWGAGDEAALAELTPLVYEELHRLADQRHRRGLRQGDPLAISRQAHRQPDRLCRRALAGPPGA